MKRIYLNYLENSSALGDTRQRPDCLAVEAVYREIVSEYFPVIGKNTRKNVLFPTYIRPRLPAIIDFNCHFYTLRTITEFRNRELTGKSSVTLLTGQGKYSGNTAVWSTLDGPYNSTVLAD